MILDIQDIINSVSVPALIKDEFIKRGTFARLKNGDLQACVGGFSIVFPVEVDGSKWAFRCWHHTLDNDQTRIKLLSAELKKAGLPFFIDFEYEDNGIVVNGAAYPTTRMKWLNGRDIKDYICYNRNNRHKLFELASNFFAMTQDLHRLSIAHGDLQHENIIVDSYGNLFLIDYDSMYVPALSYMNSKNSTNGKEGYQHPARENCVYANPTLDYFSEVVILTSILAIAYNPGLIDKYDMDDSDTMLFTKADFRSFGSSNIYSDLSSMGGIIVVLLNVLSSYLRKRDITNIEPIELAVNKANPTNAISIADYLENAENDLLKAEMEAKERKEKEEQEKKRQIELNAWRNACRNNTAAGYQIYLNEYPFGAHAEEARKKKIERKAAEAEAERQAAIKAEEEAWASACRLKTVSGFTLFLQKYPNSKYKDIANKRLKACQELEEWIRAKTSNTIPELDSFIRNYPNSIHVDEAKSIIFNIRAQLEEVSKKKRRLRRIRGIKRAIKWFLASAFILVAVKTVYVNKEYFVQIFEHAKVWISSLLEHRGDGHDGEMEDSSQNGDIEALSNPYKNESNQDTIKGICKKLDMYLKRLESAKRYLDFANGEDFNSDAIEQVELLIKQLEGLDYAKAQNYQQQFKNLYIK